jgi:hypothetical protein
MMRALTFFEPGSNIFAHSTIIGHEQISDFRVDSSTRTAEPYLVSDRPDAQFQRDVHARWIKAASRERAFRSKAVARALEPETLPKASSHLHDGLSLRVTKM